MKLPFVLSGPILRRVEPGKVYIWIATSKRCSIDAKLYTVTKKSFKEKYEYVQVPIEKETKTIRAGKHLFVHLIKLIPSEEIFSL